ncbi:MAG: HPr family phosphocarrier protein [archaeon]
MTDAPQNPHQEHPLERPKLRYEDGYTIAQVRANLSRASSYTRTAIDLCRKCIEYPGQVYLNWFDIETGGFWNVEGNEFDGKSIMSLMRLEISAGLILELKVQGTDEKAEKQVLELCSGLLSESELDFNKFNK